MTIYTFRTPSHINSLYSHNSEDEEEEEEEEEEGDDFFTFVLNEPKSPFHPALFNNASPADLSIFSSAARARLDADFSLVVFSPRAATAKRAASLAKPHSPRSMRLRACPSSTW